MDNTKEFYSIAEVAERLSVSIKTIRRHIAAGTLGSIKVGNVYRIPKDALNNFINTYQDTKDPNNGLSVRYNIMGEKEDQSTIKSSTSEDGSHLPNWIDISKEWKRPKKSSVLWSWWP